MKQISITLAIALSIFGFLAFKNKNQNAATNEGIVFFEGSWAQALEKAQKENKYIFLDAYASWCGPCKLMKHKTFTDKLVGEFYNKSFICVAIDMEKGEGPGLADKFGVTAYPTLIFLKPNGTYLGKMMGYHKPKEFLKVGEQALNAK